MDDQGLQRLDGHPDLLLPGQDLPLLGHVFHQAVQLDRRGLESQGTGLRPRQQQEVVHQPGHGFHFL